MKLKTIRWLLLVLVVCAAVLGCVAFFLRGTAQTVVGIAGTVVLLAYVIVRLRYRCPGCEKCMPILVEGYLTTHCPLCGASLNEDELS